jgi:signal transduction histidine kinase
MVEEVYRSIAYDHYAEYAENIKVSGEHLLYLVNDIVDLSVIEVGKLKLNEEKVDVPTVLDTVAHMTASHTEATNVQIMQAQSDNLPDFLATRFD